MTAVVRDLRARDAGHRARSAAELHGDLATGCQTLGGLAEEWQATGFVPLADIEAVTHTIAGLHRVLIDLRALAQGGAS